LAACEAALEQKTTLMRTASVPHQTTTTERQRPEGQGHVRARVPRPRTPGRPCGARACALGRCATGRRRRPHLRAAPLPAARTARSPGAARPARARQRHAQHGSPALRSGSPRSANGTLAQRCAPGSSYSSSYLRRRGNISAGHIGRPLFRPGNTKPSAPLVAPAPSRTCFLELLRPAGWLSNRC
jgi:hypothetical protein